MTKEVKMEIVMVMMMIWMIRTDECHAPFVIMTWSWCHVICFVLKHFKCEQYFTFSPYILLFFKYFGSKFKALKHIKELRPPNLKIKALMGLFCSVLGCSILTLKNPFISESCIEIKIEFNFYFHTSLWCLKRFYEGL